MKKVDLKKDLIECPLLDWIDLHGRCRRDGSYTWMTNLYVRGTPIGSVIVSGTQIAQYIIDELYV